MREDKQRHCHVRYTILWIVLNSYKFQCFTWITIFILLHLSLSLSLPSSNVQKKRAKKFIILCTKKILLARHLNSFFSIHFLFYIMDIVWNNLYFVWALHEPRTRALFIGEEGGRHILCHCFGYGIFSVGVWWKWWFLSYNLAGYFELTPIPDAESVLFYKIFLVWNFMSARHKNVSKSIPCHDPRINPRILPLIFCCTKHSNSLLLPSVDFVLFGCFLLLLLLHYSLLFFGSILPGNVLFWVMDAKTECISGFLWDGFVLYVCLSIFRRWFLCLSCEFESIHWCCRHCCALKPEQCRFHSAVSFEFPSQKVHSITNSLN